MRQVKKSLIAEEARIISAASEKIQTGFDSLARLVLFWFAPAVRGTLQ